LCIAPPRILDAGSRPRLGMVARLDEIKDHETILHACIRIQQQYPGSTLSLVGDGRLRHTLENLAERLGLADSVTFHGDTADIYAVMKDWDLFLYSTTLREGLSGTIPEALSIGLPVVATDLPMVREWDPAGQYVAFCKASNPDAMAETIMALMADVGRRVAIWEKAPAYVREKFSPERFVVNYLYNHN
jgi:glycosyltransferase involved in cell wall biosynthesis